ncbi:MAG: CoA transferase [Deltaproteobacteria bacterium]|nr:CoA transferase [Deltaproteobacteria bacterium]
MSAQIRNPSTGQKITHKGIKIIQLGGIGPGPFCAMMLIDLGADIIRVDRNGNPYGAHFYDTYEARDGTMIGR